MAKLLVPALIVLSVFIGGALQASASSATLSVSPATTTTDPDQTFTVTLKLHSDVDLSGAQANIKFDKDVVQIIDIQPAAPFATAAFIVGINGQSKDQAIQEANDSTGELLQVATFYAANTGSAPAGDNDFVTIEMKAINSGEMDISLPAELPLHRVEATDTSGNAVEVTTVPGHVSVSGATPTPTPPGQTPTPSPSPSPTPASTPTPTPTLEVHGSLAVSPATMSVRPGTEFSVNIVQTTDQVTLGAQFTLQFDPQVLQVESITKGSSFTHANLVYGEAPNTGPAAITEANSTGVIKQIGAFLVPGSTIPAGQTTFVIVKFKSNAATGSSDLKLSQMEMLKPDGDEFGVTASDGHIDVSSSAPQALPTTGGPPSSEGNGALWLLGLGALVLTAGAASVIASRRLS